MGITKRDAPISWRPSKDASLALAKLLEGGQKRNEVLNEAVIRMAGRASDELVEAVGPKDLSGGALAEPPQKERIEDLRKARLTRTEPGPVLQRKPTVYRQTISKPGWKK